MTQALATAADNLNPFLQYGDAIVRRTIVGDLLKFTKFGTWEHGQNSIEMPLKTRLVANMDELMIGWIRWADGKPSEHVIGKVLEGYKPPRRDELGDTDENEWDLDDEGRPKDPWQATNLLILKEESGDELFTYSPSSKGGLSCIGRLCQDYGKQMRQRPNELPVVALGAGHYVHPKYKKTFYPELQIVGWAPKAAFADALAAADEAAGESGEEIETAGQNGTAKAPKTKF